MWPLPLTYTLHAANPVSRDASTCICLEVRVLDLWMRLAFLCIVYCRYFQALASGEVPPVKDRLEHALPPPDERLGGLSKRVLAVLHKQVRCVEL